MYFDGYTVKRFSSIRVLSWEVTYQTLPGREWFIQSQSWEVGSKKIQEFRNFFLQCSSIQKPRRQPGGNNVDRTFWNNVSSNEMNRPRNTMLLQWYDTSLSLCIIKYVYRLMQNDRDSSIQGHCVSGTNQMGTRGPRKFERGHIVPGCLITPPNI